MNNLCAKFLVSSEIASELGRLSFRAAGFSQSVPVSLQMEVAYELQGTAKYMLASQGPAFVAVALPPDLIRIFKSLPTKAAHKRLFG